MTRRLPHLGSVDASGATVHTRHSSDQQLPEPQPEAKAIAPAASRQTERPAQVEQADREEEPLATQHYKSPAVEPEDVTAEKEDSSSKPVPAQHQASTNGESDKNEAPKQTVEDEEEDECRGGFPHAWFAQYFAAIDKRVGDLISQFDHVVSRPANAKDQAITQQQNSTKTKATAAQSNDPPSYADAAHPDIKTTTTEKKSSPSMKGMFHASSKEMRLDDGHILVAKCADVKGRQKQSTINLNDCLTNTNGSLKWFAGGNFKASARNASLVDGSWLDVEVKNVHGIWQHDKICLSERISNNNGKLIFLKS